MNGDKTVETPNIISSIESINIKLKNFEDTLSRIESTLVSKKDTNEKLTKSTNELPNDSKTNGKDMTHENILDIDNKSIRSNGSVKSKEKTDKSKEKKDKNGKESDGKEKSKEKSKEKKKDEGPAKEVYVAYKINCLSDISEVSCSFEVDMKAFFSWCDEKLIGRKKGESVNYEEDGKLFDPNIVVTNAHNLTETSITNKLIDSKTGEVKRTVTYKGTVFLLGMNLNTFPFDCQNLQVSGSNCSCSSSSTHLSDSKRCSYCCCRIPIELVLY
jgi:hypothetical protein